MGQLLRNCLRVIFLDLPLSLGGFEYAKWRGGSNRRKLPDCRVYLPNSTFPPKSSSARTLNMCSFSPSALRANV